MHPSIISNQYLSLPLSIVKQNHELDMRNRKQSRKVFESAELGIYEGILIANTLKHFTWVSRNSQRGV